MMKKKSPHRYYCEVIHKDTLICVDRTQKVVYYEQVFTYAGLGELSPSQ